MQRKATIGSVSSATLRTEDLLSAFVAELRYLDPGNAALTLTLAEAETALAKAETDNSEAFEMVHVLADALNEYAPPYCYFGTLEGDGADFGFWPDHAAIEELPRVNDPNEVPEGGTGEDCAFVNDHGNVTVYDANGAVILELV